MTGTILLTPSLPYPLPLTHPRGQQLHFSPDIGSLSYALVCCARMSEWPLSRTFHSLTRSTNHLNRVAKFPNDGPFLHPRKVFMRYARNSSNMALNQVDMFSQSKTLRIPGQKKTIRPLHIYNIFSPHKQAERKLMC